MSLNYLIKFPRWIAGGALKNESISVRWIDEYGPIY